MKMNQRRTYGPLEFFAAGLGMLLRLPLFARSWLRGRVSRPFMQKMMLAVTSVNGCRYCAWSLTLMGSGLDVPKDEMAALLAGSLGQSVSEAEAVGLAFSLHYAESGARPDAAALARLHAQYGASAAADILLTLRWVTFFNLAGNTFRSSVERLASGRFHARDLLLLLLTAPIFAPVDLLLRAGVGRQPIHVR
jgi:hypothetical protein